MLINSSRIEMTLLSSDLCLGILALFYKDIKTIVLSLTISA